MKSVPRFTPLKYTTRPATRTISVGNITCIFQRKLKPVESNRNFFVKTRKTALSVLKIVHKPWYNVIKENGSAIKMFIYRCGSPFACKLSGKEWSELPDRFRFI